MAIQGEVEEFQLLLIRSCRHQHSTAGKYIIQLLNENILQDLNILTLGGRSSLMLSLEKCNMYKFKIQ